MSESIRRRLLVLTSSFPRWANDTDPRFIEELCFELAREFDVTVLAPHCRDARRHEMLRHDSGTIEVRRFRYFFSRFETLAYGGGIVANIRRRRLRILLVPLFLVCQLYAAIRLQRAQRFAAIHAHWLIPQGVTATLLKNVLRRTPPVLITAHGSDLQTLRGTFASWLKRRVLQSADAVSVVSTALAADAIALGCDSRKIHVAPMGVDLESVFTPGTGRARTGIVCVGKLDPNKGVAHLLDAFAMLAPGHPGLQLQVVGDGAERRALEMQTRTLGIADQIVFRGALPQSQLPDLLRSAGIAVFPSLREGFGLVAVEAMGCGCAVVASDLPALEGVVIDGETGLLARPADAEDLKNKIAQLLTDEGLRERLGNNGRAHVAGRFDWRTAGSAYRSLIGIVVAPDRGRQ